MSEKILLGIYRLWNTQEHPARIFPAVEYPRLDLHVVARYEPGDADYPGLSPNRKRIVYKIERRGALYFPTEGYIFATELAKVLRDMPRRAEV